MSDNKRLKYLFVVNNGSGTSPAIPWEQQIQEFYGEKNELYEIYTLPEKIDLAEIKKYLQQKSPEKLIAVGGDGTITMLANMLIGTNMALGIIPAGSANGMAKELGIPTDAKAAMEIIETGVLRPSDLISINDHYCLHLSDLGLNAQLIKYFDEGNLRGKWGYARVVMKTLLNKQKIQVSINSDSGMVRRVAYMVALANAKKYGTGAVINPDGKIDDGFFEIIIVKKLRFGALLRMFLKPGRFNPKNIEIISCAAVEITSRRRVPFQIDGEYIGKEKVISASIQKGVLTLILPAAE